MIKRTFFRIKTFSVHSLSAALLALTPALAGCSHADVPTTAKPDVNSLTTKTAIPSQATSAAASLPFPAPTFSLPIIGSPPGERQNSSWDSLEAVGEDSLFVILLASKTTFDKAAMKQAAVALNSALQAQFSAKILFVLPDKSRLLDSVSSQPKVMALWDAKQIVRQRFELQTRFGIAPTQSALLVIDRAGWLRRVEKIHNMEQVSFLVKEIGDPTPQIEVGRPAPGFAMRDMNGVLRRPSDLKNRKYLLLTFFPKCFTGTCAKQLESLRDAQSELQAAEVKVWAVSVDAAEGEKGQRAFAKQLSLRFPFLPDTGRQLSILYGAALSPNQVSSRMSVLIDKQGVVRWIDKQINPTTHGADVAQKAGELKTALDSD